MDINYPHEVKRARLGDLGLAPQDPTDPRLKPDGKRRWLPLTEEEAADLEGKTPEGRAAWLASLPSWEYLARHLDLAGEPALAARARKAVFSDFDSPHETPWLLLDRLLTERGRFDLRARHRAGEFDASKGESDAWAARQTGEVGAILDGMKLR